MNIFLAVRFRKNSPILKKINLDLLKYIPYKPANINIYQYPDTIIFTATTLDPIFKANRFYQSSNSFLNFSGVPILPSYSKDNYAKSFLSILETQSIDLAYRNIQGTYNQISLLPNNTLTSFSDFSGKYPVFYSTNIEYTAISNRQLLLAHLLSTDHLILNLYSVGMLLTHGNLWLNNTVFQDVKLLEPGTYIKIPNHKPIISDFEWQIYSPFDDSKENIQPYHYDIAHDKLLSYFKSLNSLLTEPVELWVSGGKDSRVVLAYAAKANLNCTALTSGYSSSPEPSCAAEICKHFNIPHTIRITQPSQFNKQDFLTFLQYQIIRHELTLTPTAGQGKSLTGRTNPVRMGGFGGELYRKSENPYFRTHQLTSIQHTKQIFQNYHIPQDPLKLILPSIISNNNQLISSWVDNHSNLPLKVLPELFWTKYRYPYHHGQLSSASAFELRLSPLFNQDIVNIHLQAPYSYGMDQRTHYELLSRIDNFITTFPFVSDTFPIHLNPSLPQKPYEQHISPQTTTRPQAWNFLQEANQELIDLFTPKSSYIYNIISYQAIHQLLKSKPQITTLAHLNQLYIIIAYQIFFSNLHKFPKDINLDTPQTTINSNVPQITHP